MVKYAIITLLSAIALGTIAGHVNFEQMDRCHRLSVALGDLKTVMLAVNPDFKPDPDAPIFAGLAAQCSYRNFVR